MLGRAGRVIQGVRLLEQVRHRDDVDQLSLVEGKP